MKIYQKWYTVEENKFPNFWFGIVHLWVCVCLLNKPYPKPASIHGDLTTGLLFPLSPLHQIEAIVGGQGDVPLADCGVDSAGQQVGLCMQGHLHAIGQHQT